MEIFEQTLIYKGVIDRKIVRSQTKYLRLGCDNPKSPSEKFSTNFDKQRHSKWKRCMGVTTTVGEKNILFFTVEGKSRELELCLSVRVVRFVQLEHKPGTYKYFLTNFLGPV